MAVTITKATACAGGNHHQVTLDLGGREVAVKVSQAELVAPLDDEEVDVLLGLLVRVLAARLPDKSSLGLRQALNGITLALDL